MQKWLHALPCDSPKQEGRKQLLQKELERSFKDLDNGRDIFGHCDLLSANVIMLPKVDGSLNVSFIDYEYATPCPAAVSLLSSLCQQRYRLMDIQFDLANHFAECK